MVGPLPFRLLTYIKYSEFKLSKAGSFSTSNRLLRKSPFRTSRKPSGVYFRRYFTWSGFPVLLTFRLEAWPECRKNWGCCGSVCCRLVVSRPGAWIGTCHRIYNSLFSRNWDKLSFCTFSRHVAYHATNRCHGQMCSCPWMDTPSRESSSDISDLYHEIPQFCIWSGSQREDTPHHCCYQLSCHPHRELTPRVFRM